MLGTVLGPEDTKKSHLGPIPGRLESSRGEVGKQPTRSRSPKLKVTNGRKGRESFLGPP